MDGGKEHDADDRSRLQRARPRGIALDADALSAQLTALETELERAQGAPLSGKAAALLKAHTDTVFGSSPMAASSPGAGQASSERGARVDDAPRRGLAPRLTVDAGSAHSLRRRLSVGSAASGSPGASAFSVVSSPSSVTRSFHGSPVRDTPAGGGGTSTIGAGAEGAGAGAATSAAGEASGSGAHPTVSPMRRGRGRNDASSRAVARTASQRTLRPGECRFVFSRLFAGHFNAQQLRRALQLSTTVAGTPVPRRTLTSAGPDVCGDPDVAVFGTSNDSRAPPAGALAVAERQRWMTTGMMPQQLTVEFPRPVVVRAVLFTARAVTRASVLVRVSSTGPLVPLAHATMKLPDAARGDGDDNGDGGSGGAGVGVGLSQLRHGAVRAFLMLPAAVTAAAVAVRLEEADYEFATVDALSVHGTMSDAVSSSDASSAPASLDLEPVAEAIQNGREEAFLKLLSERQARSPGRRRTRYSRTNAAIAARVASESDGAGAGAGSGAHGTPRSSPPTPVQLAGAAAASSLAATVAPAAQRTAHQQGAIQRSNSGGSSRRMMRRRGSRLRIN